MEINPRVAKYKIKKYLIACKTFEEKYGVSSDLFMENFDSGELGVRMIFLTGMQQKGLNMGQKIRNYFGDSDMNIRDYYLKTESLLNEFSLIMRFQSNFAKLN